MASGGDRRHALSRPKGHPDGSLISSLANEYKWAAVDDRTAATDPARKAFRDRFVREAREKFGDDLAPDDLARRAEHLRRAHYKRLALRSAQARRKRAVQPDDRDAA
jgi:hypothetical protein